MRMKRISILLVLCMVLSMLPLPAVAAETNAPAPLADANNAYITGASVTVTDTTDNTITATNEVTITGPANNIYTLGVDAFALSTENADVKINITDDEGLKGTAYKVASDTAVKPADSDQKEELTNGSVTFKNVTDSSSHYLICVYKETYSDATAQWYKLTVEIKKPTETKVTLTLDQTTVIVKEGETVKLTATVMTGTTDTTEGTEITWTSSNESVATVENGVVTGVKAGTAIITATAGDQTKTCKVTVESKTSSGGSGSGGDSAVELKSITLTPDAMPMKVGTEATLTVTADPTDYKFSDDAAIVWTSDDNAIATVTDGTVKAVAAGTTVIKATSGTVFGTCTVTVTEDDPPAPTISLDKTTWEMLDTERFTLNATVENTVTVEWTSNDPDTATVEATDTGLSATVTAKKAGTVTITATAFNASGAEVPAKCTITIKEPELPEIIEKIEQTVVEVRDPEIPTDANDVEKSAINSATAGIRTSNTPIAENLGTAITNSVKADNGTITIDGCNESVDSVAIEDATKRLSTSDPVHTVIVPKIEINVCGAESDNTGKIITSLSFKIEAFAVVKVTTADKPSETDDETTQTAGRISLAQTTQSITILIPMPAVFEIPARPAVFHDKGQDGPSYIHKAWKVGQGVDQKVRFNNARGFSTFTVRAADAEAEYNDEYMTLKEAIDAVENDKTITVLKDNLSAIVSKTISFKVVRGEGVTTVTLEPGDGFVMSVSDDKTTYTFTKERTSGGSSGGGGGGSSKPSVKNDGTTTTPGGTTDTTPGGATAFNDVPSNAWYAAPVQYVVDRGLVFGGMGNGNFAPNANMTRAMMWTVLARYKGVDTTSGANWYEAARTWAMAQGISDGTMADGNVTREQFVTMLWRLEGEPTVDSAASFTDSSMVSSYAKAAVNWAVSKGIINGYNDGSFGPQKSATRAEVAKMLMVYCQAAEA